MSDSTWKVQVTWRGQHKTNKVEKMINVRADSLDELRELVKGLTDDLGNLEPLPQKSFAPKQSAPTKEIRSWADVPRCPTHKAPMGIRQWSPPDKPGTTLYFWTCPARDGESYCKAKVQERATAENWEQFKRLDPDERPSA